MNCGTCKYYHPPTEGENVGTCRRNPPTVVLVPVQGKPTPSNPSGMAAAVQAYFPPVGPEIVCGAYVARMAAN